MIENSKYLQEQIITYIGNKRKLLSFIGRVVSDVKKDLDKKKLSILDGFSGSGIVSRYFKQYSSVLHANDLEDYSYTINQCYLNNPSFKNYKDLIIINRALNNLKPLREGVVYQQYAPKNDKDIQEGERCFYTTDNAKRIDGFREEIEKLNPDIKHFFLAPLLYKASKHTNTSGIFKGFYKDKETGIGAFGGTGKNCLERIKHPINLPFPIFSNFPDVEVNIYKKDINELVGELPEVDVAYFDPPYNQHPYGSNYHILNTIVRNRVEEEGMSKVSGIPEDWNRSAYNKKEEAKKAFDNLIENTKAKYILISYNTEGILTEDEMYQMLSSYGDTIIEEQDYSVFKGSRNLRQRSKTVQELLFVLKKT